MKQSNQTTKATLTPEHILARHPLTLQSLANRLRKVIRAAAPEALEVPYPGWHAIGYRHPVCGYFCGLFPFDDYVKLVFEFGVLLDDPFKLLEGEGKQVRHLTYRKTSDIQPEPLRFFIDQALHLRVRKPRKP